MKRIPILTLFLIFISNFTFALYWGVFEDYEDNMENYALYKVINDMPIRYYVEDTEIPEEGEADSWGIVASSIKVAKREKELENLITDAFNIWLTDTRNMIIKEGREEEFDDIMDILDRDVLLKKVSDSKQADIIFTFTSIPNMKEHCGKKPSACISLTKYPAMVWLISPHVEGLSDKLYLALDNLSTHVIHEIGHYFGLTDQYKDFHQASVEYSTFNRMNRGDSMMGGKRREKLFCDDVDGFINLIDLTLYLETGEFPERASQENGWASFCNGKKNHLGKRYKDEFYKNAKLLNKEPYTRDNETFGFDKEGNNVYTTIYRRSY